MKNHFLITCLLLIVVPSVTYAICEGPLVPCGIDLDGDGIIEDEEQCTLCHLFVLANNIFEFFLTCIVPIVSVFMFISGGFLLMVSRAGIPGIEAGGANLFQQGKNILTALVAGIVIIFISWAILNTFLQMIGVAEWTGLAKGWWQITCPVK